MAQVHKGSVNGIPIVSLASFIDGSNKQAVAEAMLDSFKTIGFVYLVDHGLSKDKIDGMFNWVSIFYQPWSDAAAGGRTSHEYPYSLRDSSPCPWKPRCRPLTLRLGLITEVCECAALEHVLLKTDTL